MIDLSDNSPLCSMFENYYPRYGATGGSLSRIYNYDFGYICGGTSPDDDYYQNTCTMLGSDGLFNEHLVSTRVHAGWLEVRCF